MASLYALLKPVKVKLDDLLLDPNNPRFAELGQEVGNDIPEQRFGDTKVQAKAIENMKTPRFDVTELRDTIKQMGFLPMDRIVVRAWRGGPPKNGKFVVVEGNRRVTALKWLGEKVKFAPRVSQALVVGQAKRYKEGNNITPTMLREFIGGAILKSDEMRVSNSFDAGLLTPVVYAYWTTSDFHYDARKYARKMGMWYLNGLGLTQLALRAGLKIE